MVDDASHNQPTTLQIYIIVIYQQQLKINFKKIIIIYQKLNFIHKSFSH